MNKKISDTDQDEAVASCSLPSSCCRSVFGLVGLGSDLIVMFVVLSDGNPDAKRLYDEILAGYNKLVRPVKNVTDPVTVKFKLKLSQLIDVVSSTQFSLKFVHLNFRTCVTR